MGHGDFAIYINFMLDVVLLHIPCSAHAIPNIICLQPIFYLTGAAVLYVLNSNLKTNNHSIEIR